MRLLIDTHIFLWWDRQLRRVARPLRAAIEDAENDVYLSAASVWEIAVKRALDKLYFEQPIVESAARLGFKILPVSGGHAEHAGGLPRHHNDPFDRLLIAQAVIEEMALGTQDPAMRPYGIATIGLS